MMRDQELNLIPSDIIENGLIIGRIKKWLFVLAGCVIFLIIINIAVKIVSRSMHQDLRILVAASQDSSGDITGLNEIESREQYLLSMKQKLHLLTKETPTIKMIKAIDNSINDNIILTALDARYDYLNLRSTESKEENAQDYFSSNRATWKEGQGQDANRLTVQGSAISNTDIASMLTGLSGQSIFDHVRLKYSKSGDTDKGSRIKFEIECIITSQ